jgi:hypothetical protein
MKRGARVVGYDGVEIGTVVEGDRERLKIRRKDETELWLNGEAVLCADGHTVTLICYAKGVARWRLE